MDLVIVFVCGALGTALRAWIEQAWSTQTWPAATFAINLTGAFALGFLIGALSARGPDQGARRRVRLGIGTGLLGGYTTYSTFIIEGDELAHTHLGLAFLYLAGSVVLGLALAALGMLLARRLFAQETVDVDGLEKDVDL